MNKTIAFLIFACFLTSQSICFGSDQLIKQRKQAMQQQMMQKKAMMEQQVMQQQKAQMEQQIILQQKTQIEQKAYMEQKAFLEQRAAAVPKNLIEQKAQAEYKARLKQMQAMQNNESAEPITEVDPRDLWKAFDQSSEAWNQVVDAEAKLYIVNHYINNFRQKGITLRKPANYYASMIEEMSQQSPQMLASPFERVLQLCAVMEYDFGNGENPDALARRLLSQQMYLQNVARLKGK